MKIVKLEETQKFKNSDLCVATLYDFNDKDIDISISEIDGKYPEENYCMNTDVKEMIYVISGKGEIHKENEVFKFKAGDAILIDKGEKYFWIAHCKIVTACSPAWFPEQHKIVK